MTDWYGLVPKDVAENLEFRQNLLEEASGDEATQAALLAAAANDLLFFCNAFVWLFEPRKSAAVPFVTYEYQDEAMLAIEGAIGEKDVGIEKTRTMGATWMVLAIFAWRWLFRDLQSFLLVSRNQDLVDKTGDPDSLFVKLDFLLKHLPAWMLPKEVERFKLHLGNLDRDNTVDGASTTGQVGRGGRRTAAFKDEFAAFNVDDGYRALAATQEMTLTRIFGSTPQGAFGAFYDVMHDKNADMVRLRLHWPAHPEKGAGLYRTVDGKLHILDPKYQFPPGYAFVRDGKLRSPWYDKQCRRPGATPKLIAQELDIDYLSSGFPWFDISRLRQVQEDQVIVPVLVADVLLDSMEDPSVERLEPNEGGALKLWVHLLGGKRVPPDRSYVAGADISQGTGTTNSTICIIDTTAREQVAEFATPHLEPTSFSRMTVALCRLFNDAQLIWERNGPGASFSKTVRELGYRNVWYPSLERGQRPTTAEEPGWWATREQNITVLTDMRSAMVSGSVKLRSVRLYEECTEYAYLPGGAVGHRRALRTDDPSGAGYNHGDRVKAAAMAIRALRPPMIPRAKKPEPELGTFAQRRLEWERRHERSRQW